MKKFLLCIFAFGFTMPVGAMQNAFQGLYDFLTLAQCHDVGKLGEKAYEAEEVVLKAEKEADEAGETVDRETVGQKRDESWKSSLKFDEAWEKTDEVWRRSIGGVHSIANYLKNRPKVLEAMKAVNKAREEVTKAYENAHLASLAWAAVSAKVHKAMEETKGKAKEEVEKAHKAMEEAEQKADEVQAKVDEALAKAEEAREEVKEEFFLKAAKFKYKVFNVFTSKYSVGAFLVGGAGLYGLAIRKNYVAACRRTKKKATFKRFFAKYLFSLKTMRNLTKKRALFWTGTAALATGMLLGAVGSDWFYLFCERKGGSGFARQTSRPSICHPALDAGSRPKKVAFDT